MSGKRTPGEDDNAPLNNTGGTAGSQADDHERAVQAAVAKARLEEEQRQETERAQLAAQKKGPKPEVKEGAVHIPAVTKPEESKYGPELTWPDATPLIRDKAGLRPATGAERPTHIVGRVMGKAGWLVQRAIPVEDVPGYSDA